MQDDEKTPPHHSHISVILFDFGNFVLIVKTAKNYSIFYSFTLKKNSHIITLTSMTFETINEGKLASIGHCDADRLVSQKGNQRIFCQQLMVSPT